VQHVATAAAMNVGERLTAWLSPTNLRQKHEDRASPNWRHDWTSRQPYGASSL